MIEILVVIIIIGALFFSPRENVERRRYQAMSDEEILKLVRGRRDR